MHSAIQFEKKKRARFRAIFISCFVLKPWSVVEPGETIPHRDLRHRTNGSHGGKYKLYIHIPP